jgi:hypothetical protein
MVSKQVVNRIVAFLCVAACLLPAQAATAQDDNTGQSRYQLVQSVTDRMPGQMRSDQEA